MFPSRFQSFSVSAFPLTSFSNLAPASGSGIDWPRSIHERHHRKPPVQLVHALALRGPARPAHFRRVSASAARTPNLCYPRLRLLFLPGRLLSAAIFPARRDAILGPLQLLRRSVPGAMEHHAALSADADLSRTAADVVAVFFLPAAPMVRRLRNVPSRTALDGQ